MIRNFRRYHRLLALIASLPLLITMLTGVGYTLFVDWFNQHELAIFLMQIHTFKILRLGRFYPFLLSLSLLGLIVTGLSLSGVFYKRSASGSD